ncbi:EAL domain-containing protein [Azoarcus sp. KH32C]|uniref:EAL domain-containing protein n=1 Tax=Azoarcus sp. KH32C TaxID=748247 RepID=UPI000238647A|nr:EAL domain-containing protein [Azoarcus sp. KH32C]BAL22544.1 diguanylate cyclase/phosphodiesterase with PAS/PAC sensor [Azoarcus sp. KH32C]
MKPEASFETRVLIAFVAAVLVVGVLGITTWKLSKDAAEAEHRLTRSHDVLSNLAQAKASTVEIELSTQNYRLSGNPAHLEQRDTLIAAREASLQRIKQLTADEPRQQERWQLLREVVDERIAISQRVQMLRSTEGVDAANAYAASAPLQETRERAYGLMRDMDADENRQLKARNAEQQRTDKVLASVGALLAASLFALLAASYSLIRRQLRESEAIERQARRTILEQNELLEQHVRERTAQLRDSEDHLRSVIRNVPALIAYVDAEQRYVYVNEQYRARFASDRPDITGCTVREILGEERYAIASPIIAKALLGEPQSYDWQPFPGVWQLISYAPRRDADGGVAGYYVLGTDITARKEAEERIRSLNADLERHVYELEHVSRALRTLSAGNRTMLRATDEQELLDGMCRAIVETGGYDTAVVWYRLHDPAQSLRAMAESGYPGGLAGVRALTATWADNEHGRGAVGTTIRNGQTRVVRDIANDPNYAPWRAAVPAYESVIACPLQVGGEVIGALAIYDAAPDIFGPDEVVLLTESADDLAFGIATLRVRAEQQKSQEAMYRLTHFDTLTGLPNETQFTAAINAALESGKQSDAPFAVLQANIERLSEINDALGFRHGDDMLREFGTRLRSAAPASATVARLRGDEFAALLPAGDASAALALVSRLEQALAPPFPIADIALDVSARIGVALFPEHGTTAHDLYRHMDIAVQVAKKKGLGHVMFDPAQNPTQARRLTLVSELRRAIEHGDLLLYLQPKVELASGRVCGAEGLVRWKHAERGIIPPGEFIELAENTGLIKPLTEWVVETAMRLNQQWARQGRELPIAVNLSARNLHDEKLLEKIRHLQAAYGVCAGLFEMEITESAVMEDAEFALHVLHGLRNEGIPLYIDDFGTGYSSLSYLQKLPVEYIKIDQSFIRDMSSRKDCELIVRSTIDLIHDLGRKAVAEGIETRESWDRLAELGCDVGQGYFIARPMPPEDFMAWAERFPAHAWTVPSA